MSWFRSQYRKDRKQVRHGRLSPSSVQCADCLVELPGTYQLFRFAGRCRRCYSAFVAGALSMASHYAADIADQEF